MPKGDGAAASQHHDDTRPIARTARSLTQANLNSRGPYVYWRAEGSLLELTAVRPVAFFTWNSQTFAERWVRRGLVLGMAVLRPFLYLADRAFATRVVYAVLRGISQDRLDLLGEEYFLYKLKPYLKEDGVRRLKQLLAVEGERLVLVSQGLDHVVRPLAQSLGVQRIIANRLEFRDGISTGRLLDPLIRPRGLYARLSAVEAGGVRTADELSRDLGMIGPSSLAGAVKAAERQISDFDRPLVHFDGRQAVTPLSVRSVLGGKHILLTGVTGFIGKVWLANILMELPEIGRIYLLIRRQKSTSAEKRLEKLLEESPVFDRLFERHGERFLPFFRQRVEVVEGDLAQPELGLRPDVAESLRKTLDLVVNSSGLTDFNPDLREALTTNVDATIGLVQFIRRSDHAGLLHLSTCYVAGARDGRVSETVRPDYTPQGVIDFDAEAEWKGLQRLVEETEARAEGREISKELRQQ
ncbi:MAG: SDR family oxidoreductase, partial [Acidobacteria bacterium]|nr:SDR family oxidoreductase [Acidobacteriota bacterium]